MNNGLWRLLALIWLWGIGAAMADDTQVLGAAALHVAPNVLIIFDTSGSMAIEDIPAEPYRKEVDYGNGGGYESESVYRWQNDASGGRWVKLVDGVRMDLGCRRAGIADQLVENGQAWGRINVESPHDCDARYDELDLRMGNFLNYEAQALHLPMRSRLEAAKEVIKRIIDNHPGIRFGLMRFSDGNRHSTDDTEGGRLSRHGDINHLPTAEQLKADLDGLKAETFTPLAEALAEAGLYFAGQKSWYNGNGYTSPIDIKCRQNFIILMTDGASTHDQDSRLYQNNGYINGGTIGDYDGDGNETRAYPQDGSDYLDDVAAFLHENDLMPWMGVGDPRFEKQHIITHTIGFKHSHRLLQETAKNGGGRYFTAGSTDGLARAFNNILNSVESAGTISITPSVPVSRTNGVYAGDFLYMALFKPGKNSGRWQGNLKKYRIDPHGRLLDINNRLATDKDGFFVADAQSFWSAVEDGAMVDIGGAGALLVDHPSRSLYTCLSGEEKNLTAGINAFSIDNKENIPLAALGVTSDAERQAIINDIHGIGKEWVMGDILHSEPVVVQYDTNGDNLLDEDDDALVFVGTNGGVMHAFLDSTGQEKWGFIPPHHLARLRRLVEDNAIHDYFVDGPPVVVTHGDGHSEKKMLIFGDRRGGSTYTALDITSFDAPLWQYAISDDILGEGVENLGQSWGRPQLATIATSSNTTCQVLLLPGGYDTNQDAMAPSDRDTKGRAVFSVELESGRLGPFKFYNDGDGSDMTHCIVDLVGIDSDGDGVVNSIYAPDLNGNMFAFTDDDADGAWRKVKLFSASNEGIQRKIFYAPDVVRITGDPEPGDAVDESKVGEMIYFGTGDRAHPMEREVKNRFYAIKNFWWDSELFTTIADNNGAGGNSALHDATPNLIVQGTDQEKAAAEKEIKKRMGWFIELETEGEKVVSSPVVYNGTVYFTTFTPPARSGSEAEDPCGIDGDDTGFARLYGVDHKDGRAVHDHWSDIIEHDPETGEEIKTGGKADRFVEIGRAMPSAPVIAIRDGVAMLYVGVAGKLLAIAPHNAPEMNMYYWREIKP